MPELILEWVEAGQPKQYVIQGEEAGWTRVRIGRDPVRCDVVLSHPTVSGLHIEIYFDPQQGSFRLRNLRESNPPRLNGHVLVRDEATIKPGDQLYLGDLCVQVKPVTSPPASPHTVLLSPDRESAPNIPTSGETPGASGFNRPTYGLLCPSCRQTAAYEQLDLGCPWCGTSLASAQSILLG